MVKSPLQDGGQLAASGRDKAKPAVLRCATASNARLARPDSPAAPVAYERVRAEAVVQRVERLHAHAHRHHRVKIAVWLWRLAWVQARRGGQRSANGQGPSARWRFPSIACHAVCNKAVQTCIAAAPVSALCLTVVPHQHNLGHGGAAAVVAHKVAQRGHARLVRHAQQRELRAARVGGQTRQGSVGPRSLRHGWQRGQNSCRRAPAHLPAVLPGLPGCAATRWGWAQQLGGREPGSRAVALQHKVERTASQLRILATGLPVSHRPARSTRPLAGLRPHPRQ